MWCEEAVLVLLRTRNIIDLSVARKENLTDAMIHNTSNRAIVRSVSGNCHSDINVVLITSDVRHSGIPGLNCSAILEEGHRG
jgi:hypothetical protein